MGPLVIHRSGFARPPGPEFALAWVNGFGQDRRQSRLVPSGAEKQRSKREFFGRRRDIPPFGLRPHSGIAARLHFGLDPGTNFIFGYSSI